MAVEEIARLNLIIDQLLIMARAPEQLGRDDFESVDLSELVRMSCSQCEILAESAELVLKTDIADGVVIQGVPSLLGQLCYNLLQNAIKFSQPGGTIRVSLAGKGGVTLRVEDSGIGIAPEHCEAVFDRFYQVSADRGAGSGLGLALLKWTASLHQGSVTLSSVPGQGTCVEIRLSG